VEPLSSLSEESRLTLDLSGLVFIGPASLATLVAVVSDGIDRGVVASGSTYVPPANRLVARYLDRMDFNKLLTGEDLERGFTRRPPEGFRPFQTFSTRGELDELSESLTMAATEALNITGKDRTAVLLAITEIGQNVIDHAESRVGGFAIAQRGHTRREFEVAIADAGVGIAGSLGRNPQYRDVGTDAEAITKALALGVTSNPGTDNKGVGLATIRGLLRENGGTLLVRSGRGAVEDGQREVIRDALVRLGGTVVAVRMRIDQPFDLELFSRLARP
jgi:hypothetical protein